MYTFTGVFDSCMICEHCSTSTLQHYSNATPYNFQFAIFNFSRLEAGSRCGGSINNQFSMFQTNPKYNLEERTAKFGESVLFMCKGIKLNEFNRSIINQLIRSSTSVGANYMEANGASSKKDFRNKIFICKKEAQETKHWLRMLSVIEQESKETLILLWKEAQELTLIFQKIASTSSK